MATRRDGQNPAEFLQDRTFGIGLRTMSRQGQAQTLGTDAQANAAPVAAFEGIGKLTAIRQRDAGRFHSLG